MYLSGISFILLCNYFNKNRIYSVLGACIYVFSGYSLTTGIMHTYFINAMILLPLIVISINKVVDENKSFLFILASSSTMVINNLEKSGYFNLDNIEYKLVNLDIKDKIDKLKEVHLDNIKKWRQKNGYINFNDNKLLFLSIPYISGFNAKINNSTVKIFEANNGMMAIKIPRGKSEVIIDYEIPLQKVSYFISILGIILLIYRYRKRTFFYKYLHALKFNTK